MIPFNLPHLTGREFTYIQEAVAGGQLAGNGAFTRRCQACLEDRFQAPRVLLTQSCTSALEMAALLADIQPGDEVIMPSFTFVSTANAFVLRGATPVFVDIRTDTLNIDERLVEAAITPRTKAIVAVHYAGVACQMDVLLDIASRRNLILIEDAAQAFASTWNGRPLGGLGQLSAISFHETKNVISGEGGALIVNDARLISRAEILWEKGTDRVRFHRGEVGKYSWVDVGSSYLPSEVTAAFLWAQLEDADTITRKRLSLWNAYYAKCADIPCLRRPVIPAGRTHNAHMFQVLLSAGIDRAPVLQALNSQGVNAVFHYVPLHSSPAGRRFARTASGMEVTDDCSARLVRLPLWTDMTGDLVDTVVDTVREVLATQR